MDDIDRQLIDILQRDATLSIAQMAEQVGLSATPCWKRIQKLEAQGVITRRVTDYLAGMTDRYAIRLVEQLFIPKPWTAD